MSNPYQRDWQKTMSHAVCGAVIGGGPVLVGGGGWVMALIMAIVLGILAGVFLDRFWHHFLDWWS